MKALGCLLLLAAFATFCPHVKASNGLCRWEGGAGTDLSCKMEDCPKDGGAALCSQVEIKKPDVGNNDEGYLYSYCDGLNYVSNDRKWCEAAGGVWGSGPQGQNWCLSLPEHLFGDGTTTDQESFTRTVPDKKIGNPTCDQLSIDDSGWGRGSSTDDLCWSIQPKSINGLNVQDRRERIYSGRIKSTDGTCGTPWSAKIVIVRNRGVQCPLGYGARNRANGDIDCVRPAPCCTVRGDPVEVASGARVQKEDDYRFAAPRGLHLTRYYYSFGYYRPSGSTNVVRPVTGDYWRTNYDVRLFQEPAGGFALASIVRPDGRVITYSASGQPLQNDDGNADRLSHVTDGTWTLTLGEGGREIFDTSGRLTAQVDANGLQTLVAYDEDGNLGIVQDPYGRELVFSYSGGRLQSVVTPGGGATTYDYDAVGNLSAVVYPDGARRSYKYENETFRFLMTGLVDETGVESVFSYDTFGRATKNSRNGDNFVETYAYGAGTTVYTDPLGKKETFTFAFSGGVNRPTAATTSCTGCTSTVTSTAFDSNGNRASSRDVNGNLTKYTFDLGTNLETSRTEALKSDGSPSTATRSISTVWDTVLRKPTTITHRALGEPDWMESFVYDANGNTLKSTLSSGEQSRSTSYQYDSQGRLVLVDGPRTDVQDLTSVTYFSDDDECTGCRGQRSTVTDAMGHVIHYDAYDDNGNLLRARDPNGVVSLNTYDERGRLTSVTVASGSGQDEVTTYTYDGAGRVVSTKASDGSSATYTYDTAGRMVAALASDGSLLSYTRNAGGYVVSRKLYDSSGRLTNSGGSIVDPLGRLSASVDGYGLRTTYEYDLGGNRTGTMTPLGFLSRVNFDGLNRAVQATSPDGGTTRVSFNSRDQVLEYSDPNGHTTSYAYDGLGNLLSVTSPDKGVTRYTYDEAGNVIESIDARGIRSTYAYDALDRIVDRIDGADRSDAVAMHSTYDTAPHGIGRLASVASGTTLISYEYDLLGRVTMDTQKIVMGTEKKVRYRYFQGHLLEMTYPSGMLVTYGYDSVGHVSHVTVDGITVMTNPVYGPFGRLQYYEAAPGQGIQYTYDMNDRLSGATLGPAIDAAGSYAYVYDANSRLTKAMTADGDVFEYSYDLNGNRLSSKHNGILSIYGYALSSNRLTSIGMTDGGSGETLGYDDAGNVTKRGAWSYAYDNAGKLVMAQGSGSIAYSVDGRGRRVVATLGTDQTSYVYGADDLVVGRYGTDANNSYETVFLSGLPIAVMSNGGTASMKSYVAYTDQVGTIRSLAERNGVVVWAWGGEPFGFAEPTSPDGSYRLDYAGRFPGQYADGTTGLFYNLNRDYDPALGRYLQSDPIGLSGGSNTYAYVESNPGTRFDLDGKKWIASQPHSSVEPTIECDGMGGIRVFIGTLFNSKELACIKDCVIAHEMVHLEDAAYDSPCYQKDAGMQVYNPSVSITTDSEIRAYKKSLDCLRSKLTSEKSKQCPECEAILKNQIDTQADLLQRYQYKHDGLKQK